MLDCEWKFCQLKTLCRCVVDVLSLANKAGGDSARIQSQSEQLHLIDLVPPNMNISNHRVQTIVFEDNYAVIEMIIKGRGPKMRHV